MPERDRPTSVPADPSHWSEQSKRSVSFEWVRTYEDIPYKCLHCHAECVFTAQDQKHAFEVRKVHISQRRFLCADCWSESLRIRAALRECEEQWRAAKATRQTDRAFLSRWLELLTALPRGSKRDTAAITMVRRLLALE